MDSRREFLKKASLLGGSGLMGMLPPAIQKAMAINPATGSTYLDAEHIVFLMQENRSFDHAYGTLQGVRGFNDPRAISLPNNNKVWLQTNKEGETYAPFRLDIKGTKATWMSSLPHSWTNQVDARNNGKFDKWLDSKHSGDQEYAKMPLTLGHYTREDIPFYYALADAFTVCDQNFCSALTGTTPNRLFFWSGTIRDKQEAAAQANVWNENAEPGVYVNWKTYPERLEENGVSWKMYQNELYLDVGFEGEEEGWLSNFGDNAIEYFSQYNVKLSAAYIANLPKAAQKLSAAIAKLEEQLAKLAGNETESAPLKKKLEAYKKYLANNEADQKLYTKERYDQLSAFEKNIHDKAFTTNIGDPDYHSLTTLAYDDNGTKREVKVPKGDVLYQFREDVKNGQLPTVSWLTAPENFSDHPSAAWYGAWYISEVMDILTQNPEVWKKTIFILTYDENDGYFDHIPPFVAPNPDNADSGLVSSGIHTGVDYVTKDQQSYKQYARESSIGLGYRVPMVIASPWSRGGWVNSQVFDHTSNLQFLEHFLAKKTGKKIVESNISEWRRTVCGNLASTFRPYNGEKIALPKSVDKDLFIESIHKAQFKGVPTGFKKLTAAEVELANKKPASAPFMPRQEKGTRPSCALPYELYVDGNFSADKKAFEIEFKAGNQAFETQSAGSPFNVYAPGIYKKETVKTWAYAVKAGDSLKDKWQLEHFENNQFHLQVYGPNGFFREFKSDEKSPSLTISCGYEKKVAAAGLTGKLEISIKNEAGQPVEIEIIDNSYHAANVTKKIAAGASQKLVFDVSKNNGWYDFSIKIKGNTLFENRYAGRIETGKPTKTDPAMA